MELTAAGLQGLPQPAEYVDVWQRAMDELSDDHLEADTDEPGPVGSLMRKRPDAWAIQWSKQLLVILEFTRPSDRQPDALLKTDELKVERYTPLRERLARCLPGWEVTIQSFSMGIRGSFLPDQWRTNLSKFGLTSSSIDHIAREMVSQALTELTNLYNVRFAALQSPHDRGP